MKRVSETPQSRVERVRGRIRAEGAEAAYNALVAVCRDPKAPAPAKATAGVALLRAAGLFENVQDATEKEPYEMSLAELQEYKRQLQAQFDELTRGAEGPGDDDLFG